MPDIRPVVLSGGAGTRLWPLSTPALPKQFASLVPGGSLFGQTLRRLDGVPEVLPPVVVTGAPHLHFVQEAARAEGVTTAVTIVEPTSRNTAPAAIAAALWSEPKDILAILPSDHLISDTRRFQRHVTESSVHAETGRIVTFGIQPSRAETGYGYIESGDAVGAAFEVARFKEKPNDEEAAQLSSDGRHSWNSGMFVTSAGTLVAEADRHCPEVLAGVRMAMAEPVAAVMELGTKFAEVERISLDHAIMEKTDKAVVMPIDVGWDDVGSFEALWSVSEKDERGNVVSGDSLLLDVEGCYVRATSRKVAVAGLSDVVVVETPEAVLVVPRERSQMVRDLVDLI